MEIFSSVQGEGIHVGRTTLFVRFGECDLRCRWCDSPHTWAPARQCRIECERGSAQFREIANPVSYRHVVEAAVALDVGAHRFVSLTGGEPLLQPDAVGALARALRSRVPAILLETHGLATVALADVIETIDVVSMDWKLASDVRRAGRSTRAAAEPFDDAHEEFLRVAKRAPEVIVKVVVTCASRDAELDEMARRIARVDAETPVIVQPVTPAGGVEETPPAGRLLKVVSRLSRVLADVRLIPQTHKTIGAL